MKQKRMKFHWRSEVQYVFNCTEFYEIWRLSEEIYDEVRPDKTINKKVKKHISFTILRQLCLALWKIGQETQAGGMIF